MNNYPTAETIKNAKKQFPSLIRKTPLLFSERLSKLYDANVYLKREDLQPVRSYKIRGAFNVIQNLSQEERNKGVVCASAGNHAQGVAIACAYFEINGKIFMPATTPNQKVRATQKFGGKFVEIELVGDTFDSAYIASQKYCNEKKATFVHPFNDARTISGQGTIALEILTQCKDKIDFVVVPIGGGGLISGISTYFKEESPHTKIVGTEPAECCAMYESIKKKQVIELDSISTFVDGVAVKKVGGLTFEICQKNVKDFVQVPENRICTTLLELLNEDGIVAEPAGALSVDSLKNLKDKIKGKTVVCVISGSNLDFDRLPEIKERSTKFEGIKRYFVVRFAQRPGALREFLDVLGEHDDITRFEYLKKSNKEAGPALIGIESDKKENFESITQKMREKNIRFTDITNDSTFFDLLV